MATSKKLKIKESSAEKEETVEEKDVFNTEGQLVVDVYEDDTNFVVMSTIAGITAKDFEIVVDKDMLIIKGNRNNPETEEGKSYFYRECHWGPFSRKIVLPEHVDAGQVQAEFDKGLLIVKFPKNTKEKDKEVDIKEN